MSEFDGIDDVRQLLTRVDEIEKLIDAVKLPEVSA